MKKLALLIGSIGLFMICFGFGWMVGEKIKRDNICGNISFTSEYYRKECRGIK